MSSSPAARSAGHRRFLTWSTATLRFLALNGHELDPDPPGQVAALVAELAVGAVDINLSPRCLRYRLMPVGTTTVHSEDKTCNPERAAADCPGSDLLDRTRRSATWCRGWQVNPATE